MNSATPLYAHPFGCLGTILEDDHLRTLKVTFKLLCATGNRTRGTRGYLKALKKTKLID